MRAGRAPLRQGSLLCRRSVCGRHAHDGQRQAVRAAAGREPPALRGRGSEVGARSPHYENAVLTHTGGELAVSMGTHGVEGGGAETGRRVTHGAVQPAQGSGTSGLICARGAGRHHGVAAVCGLVAPRSRRARSVIPVPGGPHTPRPAVFSKAFS